ncbi:MAG: serine hydrolase [Acidobacteriota bacterium]|nr:MAG: serine hydrolase [Acidobacteriota bacterium]
MTSKRTTFLPVLATAFLLVTAWAQSPDGLEGARRRIDDLITASGAEVVGVAVHDLQSNRTLLINERAGMHAASTMKLPVMMELFRLTEEKKIDLDAEIEVVNSFRSIVDGSPYMLSPDQDSDQLVYNRIGRGMKVIDLIDRMITWSSNLATNILIEKAGADNVNRLMRRLGARDIEVRRGVEDIKAFRAGLNNTTTAYDLMLLLRAIAENRFLTPQSNEKMIEILAAQHFNDGIPAGLPPGLRVAHKTGNITRHDHDAGIVFPEDRKPYVIVVLTRGIDDGRKSSRLIAAISKTVFEALVRQ